jgi:hypothetical protein
MYMRAVRGSARSNIAAYCDYVSVFWALSPFPACRHKASRCDRIEKVISTARCVELKRLLMVKMFLPVVLPGLS